MNLFLSAKNPRNPTCKQWIVFCCLTFISIAIWFHYSYPQFAFVDLSISEKRATSAARSFLKENYDVNPSNFLSAAVLESDVSTDRFLQRALGFKKEQAFLKQHQYDLFYWKIRFFKELEKEEYLLSISASNGDIIEFRHIIPETQARRETSQEQALQTARNFLKDHFDFTEDQYILYDESKNKKDNRTDYSFSWKKKDIYIPWSEKEDSGGGQLFITMTISGNEILRFNRALFEVPEKFERMLSKKQDIGSSFFTLFNIFYYIMLVAGVFLVISRRHHLSMQVIKKFIIILTLALILLSILGYFNSAKGILFHYSTTSNLTNYLWRLTVGVILTIFVVTVAILMPGLAGESLYDQYGRDMPGRSFLHYARSSFLTRHVFRMICLGYLIALIMLGIQSLVFQLGYQYLGVWTERIQLANLSTKYFPFLAVFAISFRAAFIEEIVFRVFAISWFRKLTKSLILAIIVSSVFWGFGHTTYPIFPMWFRGIEVSLLGLFLAYVFLHFGIIAVVAAHYVFDVIWSGANYLFGQSQTFDTVSTLIVLCLPMVFGLFAFLLNQKDQEQPVKWKLSKHQLFNLKVLQFYLKNHDDWKGKTETHLKDELVSHGWDLAIVEQALSEINDK